MNSRRSKCLPLPSRKSRAFRIRDAVAYASDNIGGGEEDRHFDSTLSSIIGILEGELNSDGVPR
jgi:hypothetical protein